MPARRPPLSDTSDPAAASSASTRRVTRSMNGRGTAGSLAPGSRAILRFSGQRSISKNPTICRRKACPPHGSAPTNGIISAAIREGRCKSWRRSTRRPIPAEQWAPITRSPGVKRSTVAAAGILRWATPRNPMTSRCFAFTYWAESKALLVSPVPAGVDRRGGSADGRRAGIAIG
jgi:hypothetical protein